MLWKCNVSTLPKWRESGAASLLVERFPRTQDPFSSPSTVSAGAGVVPGGSHVPPGGLTLLSGRQRINSGCWVPSAPPGAAASSSHGSAAVYYLAEGQGDFFIIIIIIPPSFPFSFLLKAQKLVMIYLLAQRAEAGRQPQISGGTRVRLELGHGRRTLCPGPCLPGGDQGVTGSPMPLFFARSDHIPASASVVPSG